MIIDLLSLMDRHICYRLILWPDFDFTAVNLNYFDNPGLGGFGGTRPDQQSHKR